MATGAEALVSGDADLLDLAGTMVGAPILSPAQFEEWWRERQSLGQGTGVIFRGPPGTRVLALLQQLGVKATFFVIGERLQRHPAFATSAFADGHELGNHLWRDVRAFGLGASEFDDQLTRTEPLIWETLGRDLPSAHGKPLRWFRPGGGWFHGGMLRQAQSRGYRTVLGSTWPLDTYGPPAWFQRLFILTTAHPGGIVVLHDTNRLNPATLRTLAAVVPKLQRRGYGFATLTELLGATDELAMLV